MSHFASLASVVLLFSSIVLNIVSLTSVWWSPLATGSVSAGGSAVSVKAEASLLWLEVEATLSGTSASAKTDWDEVCDSPSIAEDFKSAMCPKVKAARAFLILGAIMACCAAALNGAGMYTGNTLIDSAGGLVAGFSCLCSGLAIAVAFMVGSEGLTSSPGYLTVCMGCGLQLAGAICSCIGTCQEMHDLAKLASTLHLGAFKEPEKLEARSIRAAKIRDVEQGETKMIYENLQKRKAAAEKAATQREGSDTGPVEKAAEEAKKVPVKLKAVLFRKPGDGDDDEIPTNMLEEAFAEIDGDGSGSIELEELVDALALCGLSVSKNATDTIMAEIDKNADGTVDLREFIEFFRHIEDLNRFGKKTAARAQFLSFLLNFCFLADMVVVGVMLMMFIRMDEAENPDNYSIMKNVLMACSFGLGVLFLLVILMPILRLALGPTANRMQKQYELAQEIKKSQMKKASANDDDAGAGGGGRASGGYGPDDDPPPVNAAMFGRSYRPGRVDSEAWTPAIEDVPPPSKSKSHANSSSEAATVVRAGSHAASSHGHGSHESELSGSNKAGSHGARGTHAGAGGGGHGRRHSWRYDPANYSIASEHAQMLDSAGLGPTSWTPMQVRDASIPKQTAPSIGNAPLALADAALPQPEGMNMR